MQYGIGTNSATSGEFFARFFNLKARNLGASLVMTETGPRGLELVFNENSDRSGAMLNTFREALPGREVTHKAEGAKNTYTVFSTYVPALEAEIRAFDKEGALAADSDFDVAVAGGNAAAKRADTQKMAAANQGTEHFRW